MKLFFALGILLFSLISALAQTEQAPIQEKEFKYKNWTYNSIREPGKIDLREFAAGKKLVLVVYFAPWCGNWKHEAPFVQKMYEKYKSQGFDVVGVGEYGTVDEMKANLTALGITFPTVYESDSKELKQKTPHYDYRRQTGDTRNWGSPWNIFLEPAKLIVNGDVLTKKSFIANGELIEPDAERFIREKLGLPAVEIAADKSKKEIEACPPEPKKTEFKKP